MTINEIFTTKVAKDVAEKKSVADIISAAKRTIQIHFCSTTNKGLISEAGLKNVTSKLDRWSELPESEALSKITYQIETSRDSINRRLENSKKREKEESRRQLREATGF